MQVREKCDVTIVGGGLIGATLSCALAKGGLTSIVVERTPAHLQNTIKSDGRATALSHTAQTMLDYLGVWVKLKNNANPIFDIRVAVGQSKNFLHFDHKQVSDKPLGYMVENQILRQAIQETVEEQKNATYKIIDGPLKIQTEYENITIILNDKNFIEGKVLVGADGKNSVIREYANIQNISWRYKQTAIVCTIEHKIPHNDVAYELFFPSGPLAILPLRGNRSSVVWTDSDDNAQSLMTLDDGVFSSKLEQRLGGCLGSLKVAGFRNSFPISLNHSKSLVSNRLALAGDSAHGIHPVAGQGLNMGLRDVAVLTEVLVEAYRLGLDIGASNILQKYQRWRRFDNTVMVVATDTINRLFSNNIVPIKIARGLGLSAVNSSSLLKGIFMRQAMGLTGALPELLKGKSA